MHGVKGGKERGGEGEELERGEGEREGGEEREEREGEACVCVCNVIVYVVVVCVECVCVCCGCEVEEDARVLTRGGCEDDAKEDMRARGRRRIEGQRRRGGCNEEELACVSACVRKSVRECVRDASLTTRKGEGRR